MLKLHIFNVKYIILIFLLFFLKKYLKKVLTLNKHGCIMMLSLVNKDTKAKEKPLERGTNGTTYYHFDFDLFIEKL